jgi:hypothetical protein
LSTTLNIAGYVLIVSALIAWYEWARGEPGVRQGQ